MAYNPTETTPQTLFINDDFSGYFYKIMAQKIVVKSPIYVVESDRRFPYASRLNFRNDLYHFSDEDEKNFCLEKGIERNIVADGDIKLFLNNLAGKPKGIIVSEHHNCRETTKRCGEHDVLIIVSDLHETQAIIEQFNKPIKHYYTLIDYHRGVIRHILSSVNMSKHEFIFSPVDSQERIRIERKATTHAKGIIGMTRTEAAVVTSRVIASLLKK